MQTKCNIYLRNKAVYNDCYLTCYPPSAHSTVRSRACTHIFFFNIAAVYVAPCSHINVLPLLLLLCRQAIRDATDAAADTGATSNVRHRPHGRHRSRDREASGDWRREALISSPIGGTET